MKRFLGSVLLIMLVGCSLEGAPEPEPELFTQAETLSLEAEDFKARAGKAHRWELKKTSGASAGGLMQALPDRGRNYREGYRSASPRLDHTLNVDAGTYYVWVRGSAVRSERFESDSLHIGLNGEAKVEHISYFKTELGWSSRTMRGARVKLTIPEGEQTLNVWMREDGFSFDSLLLTRDSELTPGSTSEKKPDDGPVGSSEGKKARRAHDFIESIGLGVHLDYRDTAYGKFDSVIKPKLIELGVRHLRDGAYTSSKHKRDHPYYESCRELAAEGMRFSLMISFQTSSVSETDFSKLDDIYDWCDGAIAAFEGNNEPDIEGVSNWAAKTVDMQKKLYKTVKGTSKMRHVKVMGPAVTWEPEALGDISDYLDYGNWHPYPGGNCPTCGDPYGRNVDSRVSEYREPSGDKPMAITETGYHNSLGMGQADHKPVSEEAAARYIPRLLLEHFNRGYVRSYLYELIDIRPDPERKIRDHNFGLLRYDGSEKPAYKALDNLIEVLEDDDNDFEPGRLDYTLSGTTKALHSTLLQKGDGTFYLALWQERQSFDTGERHNARDDVGARGRINVAKQGLTLNVDTKIDSVRLYTLREDGGVSERGASLSGGELELDVGDTVTLVELTP